MYVRVLGIGGWAMNQAIERGFAIGKNMQLRPAHFFARVFPNGQCCHWIFFTYLPSQTYAAPPSLFGTPTLVCLCHGRS
ncbi:hypothetical protein CISIN_1g034923mg [Citrus sinensis]|uniref:Uncharacterized protein n=1 Tax=Citrus sinensis TaxID=2711 RepID=A0A067GEA9_CITSI|nr:hypothetical protein CISIN_1g034923mg [Citrus sinensis]